MGYEGGGGSFDVSGGLFLVLEILEFFFRRLESFENYEEFWKIIKYNF